MVSKKSNYVQVNPSRDSKPAMSDSVVPASSNIILSF